MKLVTTSISTRMERSVSIRQFFQCILGTFPNMTQIPIVSNLFTMKVNIYSEANKMTGDCQTLWIA